MTSSAMQPEHPRQPQAPVPDGLAEFASPAPKGQASPAKRSNRFLQPRAPVAGPGTASGSSNNPADLQTLASAAVGRDASTQGQKLVKLPSLLPHWVEDHLAQLKVVSGRYNRALAQALASEMQHHMVSTRLMAQECAFGEKPRLSEHHDVLDEIAKVKKKNILAMFANTADWAHTPREWLPHHHDAATKIQVAWRAYHRRRVKRDTAELLGSTALWMGMVSNATSRAASRILRNSLSRGRRRVGGSAGAFGTSIDRGLEQGSHTPHPPATPSPAPGALPVDRVHHRGAAAPASGHTTDVELSGSGGSGEVQLAGEGAPDARGDSDGWAQGTGAAASSDTAAGVVAGAEAGSHAAASSSAPGAGMQDEAAGRPVRGTANAVSVAAAAAAAVAAVPAAAHVRWGDGRGPQNDPPPRPRHHRARRLASQSSASSRSRTTRSLHSLASALSASIGAASTTTAGAEGGADGSAAAAAERNPGEVAQMLAELLSQPTFGSSAADIRWRQVERSSSRVVSRMASMFDIESLFSQLTHEGADDIPASILEEGEEAERAEGTAGTGTASVVQGLGLQGSRSGLRRGQSVAQRQALIASWLANDSTMPEGVLAGLRGLIEPMLEEGEEWEEGDEGEEGEEESCSEEGAEGGGGAADEEALLETCHSSGSSGSCEGEEADGAGRAQGAAAAQGKQPGAQVQRSSGRAKRTSESRSVPSNEVPRARRVSRLSDPHQPSGHSDGAGTDNAEALNGGEGGSCGVGVGGVGGGGGCAAVVGRSPVRSVQDLKVTGKKLRGTRAAGHKQAAGAGDRRGRLSVAGGGNADVHGGSGVASAGGDAEGTSAKGRDVRRADGSADGTGAGEAVAAGGGAALGTSGSGGLEGGVWAENTDVRTRGAVMHDSSHSLPLEGAGVGCGEASFAGGVGAAGDAAWLAANASGDGGGSGDLLGRLPYNTVGSFRVSRQGEEGARALGTAGLTSFAAGRQADQPAVAGVAGAELVSRPGQGPASGDAAGGGLWGRGSQAEAAPSGRLSSGMDALDPAVRINVLHGGASDCGSGSVAGALLVAPTAAVQEGDLPSPVSVTTGAPSASGASEWQGMARQVLATETEAQLRAALARSLSRGEAAAGGGGAAPAPILLPLVGGQGLVASVVEPEPVFSVVDAEYDAWQHRQLELAAAEAQGAAAATPAAFGAEAAAAAVGAAAAAGDSLNSSGQLNLLTVFRSQPGRGMSANLEAAGTGGAFIAAAAGAGVGAAVGRGARAGASVLLGRLPFESGEEEEEQLRAHAHVYARAHGLPYRTALSELLARRAAKGRTRRFSALAGDPAAGLHLASHGAPGGGGGGGGVTLSGSGLAALVAPGTVALGPGGTLQERASIGLDRVQSWLMESCEQAGSPGAPFAGSQDPYAAVPLPDHQRQYPASGLNGVRHMGLWSEPGTGSSGGGGGGSPGGIGSPVSPRAASLSVGGAARARIGWGAPPLGPTAPLPTAKSAAHALPDGAAASPPRAPPRHLLRFSVDASPESLAAAAAAAAAVALQRHPLLPDGSRLLPDGTRVQPDGLRLLPDGSSMLSDGTRLLLEPSGHRLAPPLAEGARHLPDGSKLLADGTKLLPDGSQVLADGTHVPALAPAAYTGIPTLHLWVMEMNLPPYPWQTVMAFFPRPAQLVAVYPAGSSGGGVGMGTPSAPQYQAPQAPRSPRVGRSSTHLRTARRDPSPFAAMPPSLEGLKQAATRNLVALEGGTLRYRRPSGGPTSGPASCPGIAPGAATGPVGAPGRGAALAAGAAPTAVAAVHTLHSPFSAAATATAVMAAAAAPQGRDAKDGHHTQHSHLQQLLMPCLIPHRHSVQLPPVRASSPAPLLPSGPGSGSLPAIAVRRSLQAAPAKLHP